MAHMLHCLFFLEAKFDIILTAIHLAGVNKGAADAISRNKLEVFFDLVPQAPRTACRVPKVLVERLVVQKNWTSDDWRGWLRALSKPQ